MRLSTAESLRSHFFLQRRPRSLASCRTAADERRPQAHSSGGVRSLRAQRERRSVVTVWEPDAKLFAERIPVDCSALPCPEFSALVHVPLPNIYDASGVTGGTSSGKSLVQKYALYAPLTDDGNEDALFRELEDADRRMALAQARAGAAMDAANGEGILESDVSDLEIYEEDVEGRNAAASSKMKKKKKGSAKGTVQIGGGRLRRPRRATQKSRAKKRRSGYDDGAAGPAPLLSADGEELLDAELSEWPFTSDDADAAEDRWPLSHFLKVRSSEPLGSESRHTHGEQLTVELRNMEDAVRPDIIMERVFKELTARVVNSAHRHTNRAPRLIGVQIASQWMDDPFYVPMRPPKQNTPQALAAAFERLALSNAELRLFDGPIHTKVTAVWLPCAGCQRDDHPKDGTKARSLTRIVNLHDAWCMPRAVVVGMAYADGDMDLYKRLRADVDDQLTEDTLALIENACLDANKRGGYDIVDVQRVQRFLDEWIPSEYRLVVIQKERRNRITWKAAHRARKNICLYLEHGHYNHIGEPRELFKAGNFCVDCERPVYPRIYHPRSCRAACQLCLRHGFDYPCRREEGQPMRKCDDCDFVFPNDGCYEYHKRNADPVKPKGRPFRSICESRYFCRDCHRLVDRRRGDLRCANDDDDDGVQCERCGRVHTSEDPYCYIQP